MLDRIFLNIREKRALKELASMKNCFGGYGFLYCFSDLELKEFEKILGRKRDSLFDLYFFLEIAKNQNSWILQYAYRKDFLSRDRSYDQYFEGETFEGIIYRRCYVNHLKERLEDMGREDSSYDTILKEIVYYNSIPKLNPEKYPVEKLFTYIILRPRIKDFEDLLDYSLDELIIANKENVLQLLRKRLDIDEGVDYDETDREQTRIIINEIKRIEKLK